MNHSQNQTTQPYQPMPIFDNWNVVTRGWYIVCCSRELVKGKTRCLEVCGHQLTLVRGEDGQVTAWDACWGNGGTDLDGGQGEGKGAFHLSALSDSGNQGEPDRAEDSVRARAQIYATEEKYGFVWVYPDVQATHGVPEFDDLRGKPVVVWHEMTAKLDCHPHIYLINAVDVQHLATIHKLPEMTPSEPHQLDTSIEFTLRGKFDRNSFKGRLVGTHYEYRVRYVDGCIGLLENIRQAYVPTLHTIFAPVTIAPGKTRIQPIYVAEQRTGLLGWLMTWLSLVMAKYVYLHVLLVDREIRVFDNIRFNPKGLLAIDAPVMKLIHYINGLEPSLWSRSPHS